MPIRELGSGAVKITPGHDFNDFEVGKRAGIKPGEMLNMFDAVASVVQTQDGRVPEKYLGGDRFAVREMIVADMKAAGLPSSRTSRRPRTARRSRRTSNRVRSRTPFGDRGGVVIEPWLTDQWYVDAKTLAQPPLQAVRDGRIEIVPKTWEKTFFNWDGEYPALVCEPAAVVGAPDSGLVRAEHAGMAAICTASPTSGTSIGPRAKARSLSVRMRMM